MSDIDRMGLIERTCDRCARYASDCAVIEDAYICGECRAEIAAEEAEVEGLRDQLAGAVSALAELVRLKDGPRDDAYRAEKDAAWDVARDVVRHSQRAA